jgi:hypothetical protein
MRLTTSPQYDTCTNSFNTEGLNRGLMRKTYYQVKIGSAKLLGPSALRMWC